MTAVREAHAAEQQLDRIEAELSQQLDALARTGSAAGLIEHAESIVSRLQNQKGPLT